MKKFQYIIFLLIIFFVTSQKGFFFLNFFFGVTSDKSRTVLFLLKIKLSEFIDEGM